MFRLQGGRLLERIEMLSAMKEQCVSVRTHMCVSGCSMQSNTQLDIEIYLMTN